MVLDDEFFEYNPHPYRGGYDIALTYGQPLPPSPAICYPISSPAPPPPEPPATAAAPAPPPQEENPVSTAPQSHVDALPEPKPEQQHTPHVSAYSDPWYDYRCGYPEQSLWWGSGSVEYGNWSQLRRAADYLFGYSQGRGERIVGTDSYGIPIYANKKHGHEEPLSVQFEPASAQRVDCYEANDDDEVYPLENEQSYHDLHQEPQYLQYNRCSSPSYDGRRDEMHLVGNPSYACQQHYYEQPLSVQLEPIEPSWQRRVNEYEVREEVGSPSYGYQRHYYEQPLSIQLEPFEPSWQQRVNEYEVQVEVGTPSYAYERHYHEQPLSVQLEPFEPSLRQNVNEYEVAQELGNPSSAYRMHNYEQRLSVQLEPFEPSWSRRVNYYEVSEELSSLKYEWVDDKHFCENITNDYEKTYNEPPHFDQLEPYEPTWTQIRGYYEPYTEEVSPKSNNGYQENATQFFFPFQNYQTHEESTS